MISVKFSSHSEIVVHSEDCHYIEGSATDTVEYDGDELPAGMRLCEHCGDDVESQINRQNRRRVSRRQR